MGGREVGLVHDYLLVMRGAERTFAAMAELWPDAPVATLLHDERAIDLGRREVRTSFLQRSGATQRNFRALLPMLPLAAERLPVSDFDVVVSSSSAFAHGVRPHSGAVHVCYCHSPFRYAWFERNRATQGAPPVLRAPLAATLEMTRRWTARAADRVTHFVANSRLTQQRIRQAWGRESTVLHPPVDVDRFHVGEHEDFLLVVGEVTAHKRTELALEAARLARMPIIVVGDGPDVERLRERYRDSASFAGRVDDRDLEALYARALALVVPNVEEFGIAAVEAQASGRPVVALNAGGVQETVVHGRTGLLVDDASAEAMARALRLLPRWDFDPADIAGHARRFRTESFQRRLGDLVAAAVEGETLVAEAA